MGCKGTSKIYITQLIIIHSPFNKKNYFLINTKIKLKFSILLSSYLTKIKNKIMKQLFTLIAISFSIMVDAQNVGIGTTTPDEKLQVDSVIRVGKNAIIQTGSTRKNTIKFGDGNFATIGEQDKDDRIVLNAGSFSFRNGNVGIGVDSAIAKLDVVGSLKITNGSQGVGKVLTSDAAGNATWANAAYGNTERFYFRLSSSVGNPNALSTIYNFGTTTTTYTPGSEAFRINFTKSGLYHFDMNASQASTNDFSASSVTPRTMEIECSFAPFINFNAYPPFSKGNLGFSSASYDKSFEVYITAPSNIQFYSLKQTGNIVYAINVTGHLISE